MLALEPLWINTIWGDGNKKSPFCGSQEDIIDGVAFESLVVSVTGRHCLVPLSNLFSIYHFPR